MEIEQFTLHKSKAKKLWKQYVKECKKNPKDKFLQDMKKVYHQLRSGRKVIDINEVFMRSGLTMDGMPRLAIAKASEKEVECIYSKNGNVKFLNKHRTYDAPTKDDIVIKDVFPQIPQKHLEPYQYDIKASAPIPKIPASLRPKGDLDGYYILWEVETWKPIPPTDPYLLKRITANIFVVLAGWKLTKLERAVMKGRVW